MKPLLPGDPAYPPGLNDLEEPPPLYIRGRIPDGPCVAVVGTRSCTRYGVDIGESMGRQLASAGLVTVSGLARGIDAAAHRGTVTVRGHGVAILGSGLDHIYPRENIGLAQSLVEHGGAVVSEYPNGTPPDRWRFPARNRLIAAMSVAVVVVESRVTGGAQITAVLAAEMGRPVFAVPGDVDRESSAGTNRLIRDGAIPVFGGQDLLDELSVLAGVDARPVGLNGPVPAGGLDIDDLPDHWGCTIKEALVRLGRLEASGEVRRLGDRILPAIRD